MVSKKKEDEMEHFNYVPYDELTELNDNERQEPVLEKVIHNLIEVVKWNINFDALVFLRRLNKYHSNTVKQLLPKIDKSINKLSNSIRSNIVVECLMFLSDLFSHYTIENEEIDIKSIAPFLAIALHSTFNSKTFLRDQAKLALMTSMGDNNTFVNVSFCTEVIVQMKDDKPIISDTAFDLYIKLIEKVISYALVTNQQWSSFFNNVNELYAKKREIYVKKAVKILKDIQEKITIDKFNAILKECGLEEYIETYDNWIKLRDKKNTAHMSINDFKKQMKQKKEKQGKDEEGKDEDVMINDKQIAD